MFKKLVLGITVLAMLVGVTGCSSDSKVTTNKEADSNKSPAVEDTTVEKKKIDVENVLSSNFTIIENYETADNEKYSTQISVSELVKPNHQIGIVEKDLANKNNATNQYYYLSDDNGSYTEYKNKTGTWNESIVESKDVPTYISIVDNNSELYKDMKNQSGLSSYEAMYSGDKKCSDIHGLKDLIGQRLGIEVPDEAMVKCLIGVKDKEIARMTFDLSEWYTERNEFKEKKELKYQILVSDRNKLTELELPSEAMNSEVDVRKTSNGLKIQNSKVLGTDWEDFNIYVNGEMWELGKSDFDTDKNEKNGWVKVVDGFYVKEDDKISNCTGIKVTKDCKYSVILPSDITIGSNKVDVEKAYGNNKNYEYKSDKGYLHISFGSDGKVAEIEYVRLEL